MVYIHESVLMVYGYVPIASYARVWTWDNHGRYLVGSRGTADELRIRRFDELDVK